MRKVLIALSALLLAGCATGYGYSGYDGRGYGDYYQGGRSSYYGGYDGYYGSPYGYSGGYGSLGYHRGRGYYGGLHGGWGYPWYGGYSSWYGWPGYGYGYYRPPHLPPSRPTRPGQTPPSDRTRLRSPEELRHIRSGGTLRPPPTGRAGTIEAPRGGIRSPAEARPPRIRPAPVPQSSPRAPSQNRIRTPVRRGDGGGASLSQPAQSRMAMPEARIRQPAAMADSRLRQPAAAPARIRQPSMAPAARMPAPTVSQSAAPARARLSPAIQSRAAEPATGVAPSPRVAPAPRVSRPSQAPARERRVRVSED